MIDFGPHLPGAFFEGHLQTPSRRVDCCPPAFADALERAEQIFLELESESDRALKLVSGREPLMHNSWYANVARLQRGERDRNYLYMHPLDAAERGLAEGSRVLVSNRNGSLEVELRTAEDLMRGAAALVHGFGHGDAPGLRGAQRSAGVNPNRLLPSGPGSFEPLSSQVHMTGIPIEVRAL